MQQSYLSLKKHTEEQTQGFIFAGLLREAINLIKKINPIFLRVISEEKIHSLIVKIADLQKTQSYSKINEDALLLAYYKGILLQALPSAHADQKIIPACIKDFQESKDTGLTATVTILASGKGCPTNLVNPLVATISRTFATSSSNRIPLWIACAVWQQLKRSDIDLKELEVQKAGHLVTQRILEEAPEQLLEIREDYFTDALDEKQLSLIINQRPDLWGQLPTSVLWQSCLRLKTNDSAWRMFRDRVCAEGFAGLG